MIGDGRVIDAVGTGTVQLRMAIDGQQVIATLTTCTFPISAPINLFNVPAATRLGYIAARI
jgi:hypothetical protein